MIHHKSASVFALLYDTNFICNKTYQVDKLAHVVFIKTLLEYIFVRLESISIFDSYTL